jgi:hypothetical protein
VKSEPTFGETTKKNNLPPLTKNFFTASKKNSEDSDIKTESFNIINLSKVN